MKKDHTRSLPSFLWNDVALLLNSYVHAITA